jgi:hypothetical protein
MCVMCMHAVVGHTKVEVPQKGAQCGMVYVRM